MISARISESGSLQLVTKHCNCNTVADARFQVIADLLREAEEMTKSKRRRSSDSMARMVKKIKL
jgi:hypothetical protein